MTAPAFRTFAVTIREGSFSPFRATASKARGETLDYSFDWSDAFDASDQIVASGWSADDAALQISDLSFDGTVTTAWLASGTAGVPGVVRNVVSTAGGRSAVAELALFVSP